MGVRTTYVIDTLLHYVLQLLHVTACLNTELSCTNYEWSTQDFHLCSLHKTFIAGLRFCIKADAY